MASEAISLVIYSMPEPFNKFCSVIWNGLERQEAQEAANQKLVELARKVDQVNPKQKEATTISGSEVFEI